MMQVALFFRSENKTRQFNGSTIYFQLEQKKTKNEIYKQTIQRIARVAARVVVKSGKKQSEK